MADYSMVRDQSGSVCGLWLRSPEEAQNRELLTMLLIKHNLPRELSATVLSGDYRVVSNTFDNAGGCFVMFGKGLAPGEKTMHVPGKKWWQFWK